ncbi:hypothetical protein [Scytonema sp. PCC 10023]
MPTRFASLLLRRQSPAETNLAAAARGAKDAGHWREPENPKQLN